MGESARQKSSKRSQQRSGERTRHSSGGVTQWRSGQQPCEGETLAKRQARPDSSSAADIMAANPATAGESGLAAAAEGVGAGGTIDPLDNVRAIFITLGMTITQRDVMINSHNLTGMDNFDYIRVNDTGSFVKVWNETSRVVATEVGMPTQCKLQGFLYWYHYQGKRVMVLTPADFDATAMRLAVNKFEAKKAGKEMDLTDLDPGKIEKDLKCWRIEE